VAARLRDDAETARIWPHRFTLSLVAEAAGDTLTLTLTVRNEAGSDGEPFAFTAALHTYLAVGASGRVHGLGGRNAEDNAAPGNSVQLADAPLPVLLPQDLAVRGTTGPVEVDDGVGGRLRLAVEDGFDSLVVWNPGPDHGLADVPPDGASQFLCVEPAVLTPVRLEPREAWRATTCLTALVP
jgi:glucose-6-phosphate 1-epimerase